MLMSDDFTSLPLMVNSNNNAEADGDGECSLLLHPSSSSSLPADVGVTNRNQRRRAYGSTTNPAATTTATAIHQQRNPPQPTLIAAAAAVGRCSNPTPALSDDDESDDGAAEDGKSALHKKVHPVTTTTTTRRISTFSNDVATTAATTTSSASRSQTIFAAGSSNPNAAVMESLLWPSVGAAPASAFIRPPLGSRQPSFTFGQQGLNNGAITTSTSTTTPLLPTLNPTASTIVNAAEAYVKSMEESTDNANSNHDDADEKQQQQRKPLGNIAVNNNANNNTALRSNSNTNKTNLNLNNKLRSGGNAQLQQRTTSSSSIPSSSSLSDAVPSLRRVPPPPPPPVIAGAATAAVAVASNASSRSVSPTAKTTSHTTEAFVVASQPREPVHKQPQQQQPVNFILGVASSEQQMFPSSYFRRGEENNNNKGAPDTQQLVTSASSSGLLLPPMSLQPQPMQQIASASSAVLIPTAAAAATIPNIPNTVIFSASQTFRCAEDAVGTLASDAPPPPPPRPMHMTAKPTAFDFDSSDEDVKSHQTDDDVPPSRHADDANARGFFVSASAPVNIETLGGVVGAAEAVPFLGGGVVGSLRHEPVRGASEDWVNATPPLSSSSESDGDDEERKAKRNANNNVFSSPHPRFTSQERRRRQQRGGGGGIINATKALNRYLFVKNFVVKPKTPTSIDRRVQRLIAAQNSAEKRRLRGEAMQKVNIQTVAAAAAVGVAGLPPMETNTAVVGGNGVSSSQPFVRTRIRSLSPSSSAAAAADANANGTAASAAHLHRPHHRQHGAGNTPTAFKGGNRDALLAKNHQGESIRRRRHHQQQNQCRRRISYSEAGGTHPSASFSSSSSSSAGDNEAAYQMEGDASLLKRADGDDELAPPRSSRRAGMLLHSDNDDGEIGEGDGEGVIIRKRQPLVSNASSHASDCDRHYLLDTTAAPMPTSATTMTGATTASSYFGPSTPPPPLSSNALPPRRRGGGGVGAGVEEVLSSTTATAAIASASAAPPHQKASSSSLSPTDFESLHDADDDCDDDGENITADETHNAKEALADDIRAVRNIAVNRGGDADDGCDDSAMLVSQPTAATTTSNATTDVSAIVTRSLMPDIISCCQEERDHHHNNDNNNHRDDDEDSRGLLNDATMCVQIRPMATATEEEAVVAMAHQQESVLLSADEDVDEDEDDFVNATIAAPSNPPSPSSRPPNRRGVRMGSARGGDSGDAKPSSPSLPSSHEHGRIVINNPHRKRGSDTSSDADGLFIEQFSDRNSSFCPSSSATTATAATAHAHSTTTKTMANNSNRGKEEACGAADEACSMASSSMNDSFSPPLAAGIVEAMPTTNSHASPPSPPPHVAAQQQACTSLMLPAIARRSSSLPLNGTVVPHTPPPKEQQQTSINDDGQKKTAAMPKDVDDLDSFLPPVAIPTTVTVLQNGLPVLPSSSTSSALSGRARMFLGGGSGAAKAPMPSSSIGRESASLPPLPTVRSLRNPSSISSSLMGNADDAMPSSPLGFLRRPSATAAGSEVNSKRASVASLATVGGNRSSIGGGGLVLGARRRPTLHPAAAVTAPAPMTTPPTAVSSSDTASSLTKIKAASLELIEEFEFNFIAPLFAEAIAAIEEDVVRACATARTDADADGGEEENMKGNKENDDSHLRSSLSVWTVLQSQLSAQADAVLSAHHHATVALASTVFSNRCERIALEMQSRHQRAQIEMQRDLFLYHCVEVFIGVARLVDYDDAEEEDGQSLWTRLTVTSEEIERFKRDRAARRRGRCYMFTDDDNAENGSGGCAPFLPPRLVKLQAIAREQLVTLKKQLAKREGKAAGERDGVFKQSDNLALGNYYAI